MLNIGGGRANSCSIWEAFEIAGKFSDRPQKYQYVDENRIGDPICYISGILAVIFSSTAHCSLGTPAQRAIFVSSPSCTI